MINLEEYSDEDYILYQVANWAMLGLVDIVNLDYDFKFYSLMSYSILMKLVVNQGGLLKK